MNSSIIKLTSVVRDRYGRVGIVCSREPEPSKGHVDQLLDSEPIKKLGKTDWWGVMPFGGGYLLCAGPLLQYIREATYEDFIQASDTAGPHGRERLVKLFPNFVDRLLSERRAGSL